MLYVAVFVKNEVGGSYCRLSLQSDLSNWSKNSQLKKIMKWNMIKLAQLFGFILTLFLWGSVYLLLLPLNSEMSDSAGASLVMPIILFGLPVLFVSCLIIIPSTFMLLFSKVRNRSGITGRYWLSLLGANIIISFSYLTLLVYISYNLIMQRVWTIFTIVLKLSYSPPKHKDYASSYVKDIVIQN